MSKTLGQKRVNAEFNPSKSDLVSLIKNKAAELIDLCQSMRNVGSEAEELCREKHRAIEIAQTKIETACMYAVKACFTDQ